MTATIAKVAGKTTATIAKVAGKTYLCANEITE